MKLVCLTTTLEVKLLLKKSSKVMEMFGKLCYLKRVNVVVTFSNKSQKTSKLIDKVSASASSGKKNKKNVSYVFNSHGTKKLQ